MMPAGRTSLKKEGGQLSVALLMQEPADAQRISHLLREMNVYCYYFDDLDDFVQSITSDTPYLTIIDVRKMSKGEIVLKDLALVQADQVPLSFFYTDKTRILLNSTYTLFNYGTIHSESDLAPQLKVIFKRLKKHSAIHDSYGQLEERVGRLQARNATLIGQMEEFKQEQQFQSEWTDIVNHLQADKEANDFNQSMLQHLSDWSSIKRLALYEGNNNGQKLVAPLFKHEKYFALPSVWAGQNCEQGFTPTVRTMASRVVSEFFDGEFSTIGLQAEKGYPEVLLYLEWEQIEVSSTMIEKMEFELSGLYSAAKLRKQNHPMQSRKHCLPWELLGKADQMFFEASEHSSELIEINFKKLIELAKNKSSIRFFWDKLAHDWSYQLEQSLERLSKENRYYQITSTDRKTENFCFCSTIDRFFIWVDKSLLDSSFALCKETAKSFPLWRYFEDSDVILAHDLVPEVKMVPVSALAILRQVEEKAITNHTSVVDKANKRPNIGTQLTL